MCYSNVFFGTHLKAEELNLNPELSASPFAQQRNSVPQTHCKVSHPGTQDRNETSLLQTARPMTNEHHFALQPVPA